MKESISILRFGLYLAAAGEALLGLMTFLFGLLGVRSYLLHDGRDLYFLSLVAGVTLIGVFVLLAAWLLTKRRYWGQLLLIFLPLAPILAVATD